MSVRSSLLTDCFAEDLLKGRGEPCYFFSLLFDRNTNKHPKCCAVRSVPGCTAMTARHIYARSVELLVQVPASLPKNMDLLIKRGIVLFTSQATCCLVALGGAA